ncbi:BQ2448_134 [Microbotryum intermedium]|uniref:BQ2448_134 protein n=1 Tax=Microbotryum intermedium TaxID=269621 RepID=A0A238F7L4_9BASI|nr:BQ2448_134 [Microbotryum intermedium]
MLILLLVCHGLLVGSALAGPGFSGKTEVSAYFASYNMAPSEVPYSRYTHLNYFVFETTPSASSLSRAGISSSVVTDFVTRAHAAKVKVSYTVGGWTGSKYFSQHASNNRTLFAQTLVNTMKQYNFDGIDIDWEFPGVQGIGDNLVQKRDSDNFLRLLQSIRKLAPSARISLAVPAGGLQGPNGPLKDMTSWLPAFDYLTIMTYDIFGTWGSTTGPNSPLSASCAPSDIPYSIESSVNHYRSLKIPANRILLGFPSYSYAYTVEHGLLPKKCPDGSTSYAYQPKSTTTTCGNWVGTPSPNQYTYRELLDKGYLAPLSSSGFNFSTIDRSTQTRLIYNPSSKVFVETEDPTTARYKGTWIKNQGLAGVNMFDLKGDDKQASLITAVRRGLGMR